LRMRIIKNVFGIGMSPFMMNVCACCVTIFINNRLLAYGNDYSIGAFGIINRVQMLFVMIIMGIAQGMQPITGYNFGAERFDRVKQTLKLCIIAATIVTSLGCFLGVVFPQLFVGAFTDDPALVGQSLSALQISVAMFPVVGSQIIICQFFQSVGKAWTAIFLSLSRQLLFLLPGLALLPPIMGINGVWTSMPVSDFLAAAVAVWMLVYQFRHRFGMDKI